MYTCQECEQQINTANDVCPYCGADQRGSSSGSISGLAGAAEKSGAKRIIITCGILLVILAAVGLFAVPWHMGGSKVESESRARDAIEAIQETLASYESSEATFPSSLESLGDTARIAAQKAQLGHYTLQYTPGKPEADGRVKSYTLIARPGNFGFLNFYADETGILRATVEDRAATVQDPPVKPNL
jgi:type II secretory pathway pseudopilin PulG